MLELGGKGCMIIILKGRHADMRQMEDGWPWRRLEECPILSFVFSVSRTLVILFPCQRFCFQPIRKDLSLPNRRRNSAKDKVLISRSNADGKPFFFLIYFPLQRPVPDVLLYLTSGWSDTRRAGQGASLKSEKKNMQCGIGRLRKYPKTDFFSTHLVRQFFKTRLGLYHSISGQSGAR